MLTVVGLVAMLASSRLANASPIASNMLRAGQSLGPGQELVSSNGNHLIMQAGDGNLVLYSASGRALWASNTEGHPGARLVLQSNDGNLVIYAPGGPALWASGTVGNGGDTLVLDGNGIPTIHQARTGSPLWTPGLARVGAVSVLAPNDAVFSPSGSFLEMQADGLLVYFSPSRQPLWTSGTTVPGSAAVMQPDGNLVVYAPHGPALWASNTAGNPGASLSLSSPSHLAVVSPTGVVLWVAPASASPYAVGPPLTWNFSNGSRPVHVSEFVPQGIGGPLATVVFVPGYDAQVSEYDILLEQLAAAGYLVLGVDGYGYSSYFGALQPIDQTFAEEAGDVSAALTSAESRLGALINRSQVGALGHSDGGDAVSSLDLNTLYRDARFSSFASLGGGIAYQIPGTWAPINTAPLLAMTGTQYRDIYNWNGRASQSLYDLAAPPAAYVIVSGGGHVSSYLCPDQIAGFIPNFQPCNATLDAMAAESRAAIVAWFNETLRHVPGSAVAFHHLASTGGLVLQTKGGV